MPSRETGIAGEQRRPICCYVEKASFPVSVLKIGMHQPGSLRYNISPASHKTLMHILPSWPWCWQCKSSLSP